ncbi:MAG: 6-pyruvoyl tetrahydropterin synthase family protein [Pseudobdellovibrionaceae bacterium]
MSYMTLRLFKENFKFSSAHFLIFDQIRAERLHGHNYQVSIDLKVPEPGAAWVAPGYYIDFHELKRYIRSRLNQWDEYVLLPGKQPEMKFVENGRTLEVTFRDRFYAFPKEEVILLPIQNTSVEELSRLIAEDVYKAFHAHGLLGIKVCVEETPGQGAVSLVGETF